MEFIYTEFAQGVHDRGNIIPYYDIPKVIEELPLNSGRIFSLTHCCSIKHLWNM